MSGPKHLPGPWEYGVPVKGGRAVVGDANGNVVCVVEGGPLRREVTIANAQLIAAAPRLAAALKEIAEWPNGGNRYGQQNIKEFARAALREEGVES